MILGQPLITSSRMETKVFDNGAVFARVKSFEGRQSIQFLMVRSYHERKGIALVAIPRIFEADY